MRRRGLARLIAAVSVVALFAAACGDDDDDTAAGDTTAGGDAAEVTTTATGAPTETSGAAAPATGPIVIGAAIDLTGNMAPFDGPALAAAQITVDKINAAGGVLGRQLELRPIDTALDPAETKAAALDLIGGGAHILLTTCDVDFATPAIQEGINAGILTIAPCIGTDQMGPSRFGEPGRLAFSIGNLAQDEGAVLAEHAIEQGHTTAIVVPDNLLVYFQNVCQAFTARFEELGGEVVAEEGFASFDGSVNNLATAVSQAGEADVIALCTFPPDISTAVGGIRDAGIDTPIYSPWSGDGSFWIPEGLSDFTFSTYASVFGDDPSAEMNELIAAMEVAGAAPATGGFVTGAAAIEAIVAAIEAAGSTDGAALAAEFESFAGLPTISGNLSYSPELHTVFGREYRIMTFQDGVATFDKLLAATSPAVIS